MLSPAPVSVMECVDGEARASGGNKCPWSPGAGQSPPAPVCSLEDVMSEELAQQLNDEELKSSCEVAAGRETSDEWWSAAACGERDVGVEDGDSDLLLAQMLQAQYDQEYDDILNKEEDKLNGTSKVSISFSNYRKTHPALYNDDDEEDDSDDDIALGGGVSVPVGPGGAVSSGGGVASAAVMPRKGYTGSGKNITTKHDAHICGRRNASRVMQFPPGFETGNSEDMDMKLSNQVYNVLKIHSYNEEKRGKRTKDKQERAVTDLSLDPKTRLLLFKLVNSGTLESISGCISTGKESTVFHAFGGRIPGQSVPSECAVKVFRTTLNEFKTREKYMQNEHKFMNNMPQGRQNPRKFVRLWAEKEMHNLNRMRRLGIPCPEVVTLKKHVLVMTFVGSDRVPAPKLKDAELTVEQRDAAYQQIRQMMRTLYAGHLVHADLSEYNMLWHNSQVWLIDVSQSVSPLHINAHHFLLRDCHNVCNYFSKCGVTSGVLTPSQLFNEVTQLDLPGEGDELLAQIQEFEKNRELLAHGLTSTGKSYNFDYFWDRSHPDTGGAQAQAATQQDNEDSEEEEEEGPGTRLQQQPAGT